MSATVEPSRLAAIVVYFRTARSLTACLDGLRTQTKRPDEIVVIDNSSAIDDADRPPASGDDWDWIRAERNLGFGAACNMGARITKSDYLLFLNADVVLREKASQRLCSVAENDRHVGVVGPRIYAADGEIELSARAFPTVATGLLGRSSALTKALTRMNRTPSGLAGALGAGGRVDWVSGACMLISRRAFDDVRGFDESYWMYWEDADLCRRMREGGWATMLATDAEARHATGSSGRSELTIEAFHNSAARYYEQHLARTALDAGLARRLLLARMRIMLYRHAQHSDN